MRIQKYLIVIIALAGCFAFIGCGGSNTTSRVTIKPAYSITITQLASHLGLTVQKGGAPYYELTNAYNRVMLFTYENGRVYVNGAIVCPIGTVAEVNGSTYVSRLLIPKIRGHLLTSSPIAVPDTTYQSISGIVVVDPGHGGRDPGAQSILGYWEKDVNLIIARKLASYLENRGATVIMTRNSDTFVELNERAEIANRAGADLFVSVHADSHPSSSQNGYTIYVARSASWSSKKIGVAIERTMGQTGLSSVGIRNQDFRVLVRTRCPAVLVECGYLTNPSEADMLYQDDFQNRVARAIADGVAESL
ncbi:MAG: N-acetylmuramoyl-L-alanine amidase [Planctomycetota bacterium]